MSALVVAENPAVPETALAEAPAENVGGAAVNPKAKGKGRPKACPKAELTLMSELMRPEPQSKQKQKPWVQPGL